MITVDHEQGMATDHGEIWIGEAEEGAKTIVTMMLAGDRVGKNELLISYEDNNNETVNLYVPLERYRALLTKADDLDPNTNPAGYAVAKGII